MKEFFYLLIPSVSQMIEFFLQSQSQLNERACAPPDHFVYISVESSGGPNDERRSPHQLKCYLLHR